ncbi:PE family protein [Mycobacterium kansasii 732]|nr:PE family protein [Mycobacterium kansasii 732]
MSFVVAAPEWIATTASDVAGVGSALTAANAAAALPTTAIVAAAEDEVSAAIAAVFGSHAQGYQALSAQMSVFHEQFVAALTAGAGAYAATEAASTSPLGQLLGLINAPTQALLGRPLIGNGTNGADGTGLPVGLAGSCSATAVTAVPGRRVSPVVLAETRGCSVTAGSAGRVGSG